MNVNEPHLSHSVNVVDWSSALLYTHMLLCRYHVKAAVDWLMYSACDVKNKVVGERSMAIAKDKNCSSESSSRSSVELSYFQAAEIHVRTFSDA